MHNNEFSSQWYFHRNANTRKILLYCVNSFINTDHPITGLSNWNWKEARMNNGFLSNFCIVTSGHSYTFVQKSALLGKLWKWAILAVLQSFNWKTRQMSCQFTLANNLFGKETQMKRLLCVNSFISTDKLKRQFSRFGITRQASTKDILQIYLLVL